VLAPLAEILPHSISPYLSLMVLGFVVGTLGHIARSRLWIGIGIAMIFLATLLLPLAIVATHDTPETGGRPIYAPGTR
jgi:hypothetical protein